MPKHKPTHLGPAAQNRQTRPASKRAKKTTTGEPPASKSAQAVAQGTPPPWMAQLLQELDGKIQAAVQAAFAAQVRDTCPTPQLNQMAGPAHTDAPTTSQTPEPQQSGDLATQACTAATFAATQRIADLHQSKSLTAKADGSEKYTVCVEGNIGSGKTTFLDYFRTQSGIEVIQEPVAMWRNVRGHNVLDLMYQNPIRWSTTMQSYVQFTMLDIHTRPQKKPVRMMERSIHSARYCFVENLHNSGDMSDFEFDILDKWYQWILRSHAQDVHVDRIVYLDTSPETCHERIRKRSRSEETRISLELLKNLHDLHESWLKRKRFPLQAPVLVIDANCDVSSMFEKYREHEDWIMGRTAAS